MALKTILYEEKKFDISYDIINPQAKISLIVLHGWGSNKEIMKQAFSSTMKEFKHVYLDMPGFGKSSNEYVLTTQEYSKIINEFLIQINVSKDIIMGHSFGGKVATLLKPDTLVLLSSAGILEQKSFGVKAKIALSKVLKPLGLGSLTKLFRSADVNKMSEQMYGTFKNVVNEDFSQEFKSFNNRCMIFWGETDTATSLESGKMIHDYIKNSAFKSYPQDHYFFLKNAQNIGQEIEHGIL